MLGSIAMRCVLNCERIGRKEKREREREREREEKRRRKYILEVGKRSEYDIRKGNIRDRWFMRNQVVIGPTKTVTRRGGLEHSREANPREQERDTKCSWTIISW